MRGLLAALLAEHDAAGMIPTSSRFLFYELVTRGQLSKEKDKSRPPDHIVHTALTHLREHGHVPWDWIVDETRALENFTGAASVHDWITSVLAQARLDPWAGEPPMVIVESRSLAGTLRSLCDRYAVQLASTNGQVGGFLHTDIIPQLHGGATVLYLGDWDLAGEDIEANTRAVLEHDVGPLHWERVALTEQQVQRYHLPRITKKDNRFRPARTFEAVETEALSQERITALLQRRLDQLLPEPLERVLKREARQRKKLKALLQR